MSTAVAIRPPGRPTLLNQYLADVICLALMEGRSLRSICRDETMPNLSTVCRWLAKGDDDPVTAEFCKQYARARRVQAEILVDEILEIADDSRQDDRWTEQGMRPDTEWISRTKLRVEARQWFAAKVLPKLYGDKQQVEVTTVAAAPSIDPSKLTAADLDALEALLRKALPDAEPK